MRLALSIVALLFSPAPALAQPNKITTTLDGITFDSDYDNGSLRAVTRTSPDRYRATIFTESGERGDRKYWFRFTLSGVAGRSIDLTIDHRENPRPFIRILDPGPSSWRRLSAAESPDTSSIVLNFSPAVRTVELAFFEPLGVSETTASVDALTAASPHTSTSVIGTSHQGRDLYLVTVDNPRYADTAKHRVWVHSRAHAGEVTSTHTLLGFLDQVLEDSETGRRLREHCLFDFVPLLNVDGTHLGYTRWDALGIDPESEWCNIRTPEVAAVKTVVDQRMASPNPIGLALNLHSTRGNFADTFFFKHLSPSVSRTFERIQQAYIDAFADATPLFANRDPQSSQLNACAFIESYFWNNWGESVMALTHEGHYYRRITDGDWITGADYAEIGRAQARALIAYFDLPPTSEPDLTYARWQSSQFTPAEAAISAPEDDPDRDNIPNLSEYAFGLDPKRPDPSPLSITRDSTTGTTHIAYPRAQHLTDITFTLQHATDLKTWKNTPATKTTTPEVKIGDTYIDITTASHTSPQTNQHYRLQVTLTP